MFYRIFVKAILAKQNVCQKLSNFLIYSRLKGDAVHGLKRIFVFSIWSRWFFEILNEKQSLTFDPMLFSRHCLSCSHAVWF